MTHDLFICENDLQRLSKRPTKIKYPVHRDAPHSQLTWLMTYSYVPWLIHIWHDWFISDPQRTGILCILLLHRRVSFLRDITCDWFISDMTHDIFIRDMTHSHVTWLIDIRPTKIMHPMHLAVCATWLHYLCDVTHSYVRHDSFKWPKENESYSSCRSIKASEHRNAQIRMCTCIWVMSHIHILHICICATWLKYTYIMCIWVMSHIYKCGCDHRSRAATCWSNSKVFVPEYCRTFICFGPSEW